MQALVNAGGKGTRMGRCGIEKPMQMIGDRPTVCRVIDALMASKHIDRVLGETLGASHLRLDRLHMVGNPNLGRDTTPEDVLAGEQTLLELVGPYKPVELLCVREDMAAAAAERAVTPVLPLKLYLTYPWEDDLP